MNDDDDDNENNCSFIEWGISEFLQSTQCASNCLQRTSSRNNGAVVRGRASNFQMHVAYAHLTKICVSVYYNYHLGQKHEQQQIQARVQTYSLNQSFPAIAAFVELNSSNY